MSFVVFISYASEDFERLKIQEITKFLKRMKDIEEVYYWDGWHGYPGDIIDFMEQGVTDCEIFIAVCTEASTQSENCEKERKLAIFQNKRLIPLFEDFSIVPLTLQTHLGVNIKDKDTLQIIDAIYTIIIAPEEDLGLIRKDFIVPEHADVLAELQNMIGKEIPILEETFGFRFGVKISGKRITELGLSLCELKSLPATIGQLRSLKTLILSSNNLKSLPESIGELKKLKHLDLSHNQLGGLDESIGQLHSLWYLYLSDNRLENLPESIGQLYSLRYLDLSDNQLQSLPESIGELCSLRGLELNKNKNLKFLPDSLLNLDDIRRLSVKKSIKYLSDEAKTILKTLKKKGKYVVGISSL